MEASESGRRIADGLKIPRDPARTAEFSRAPPAGPVVTAGTSPSLPSIHLSGSHLLFFTTHKKGKGCAVW